MFGFFKKKQPPMMDGLIKSTYGNKSKSANLDEAVRIADQTLLQQRISLTSVYETAKALFEGPMPYSTHDLAVATALRFLKDQKFLETLKEAQLYARIEVERWKKDGRVVAILAESFESVLASRYGSNTPPLETVSPDEEYFSEAVKNFAGENRGATPQQVAKPVRDFMAWQYNFAQSSKLDHDEFDDEREEITALKDKTVVRAYMFGASLAAMHAFSLAENHIRLFRLNVISMYHGWDDVQLIDEEIDKMYCASKDNEEISDAGFLSMIDYLIEGKMEERRFDLAEQMGY